MCGIIGYVGSREAKPLLLQGLKRLEYRGYDSAGIALREDDKLDYVRAVGNLANLIEAAGPNGSVANHGLGHTRWATHGGVTEQNAHPLTGCDDGKVAIVLNGIVENYRELKGSLAKEGHEFDSETDAEVVAHLVERHYEGDLVEAVRAAYAELEGHYAFVVIHHDHPNLLVGARHQCPLVVGVDDGVHARDPADPAPRRRGGRRDQTGRRTVLHKGRARRAQGDRAGRVERRRSREGWLRDVHAQGDLRTTRRGARDDRRPHSPGCAPRARRPRRSEE